MINSAETSYSLRGNRLLGKVTIGQNSFLRSLNGLLFYEDRLLLFQRPVYFMGASSGLPLPAPSIYGVGGVPPCSPAPVSTYHIDFFRVCIFYS